MIQCQDCEFFERGEAGEVSFSCDPFSNVKGPECIAKLQLIKIDHLINCYQATLQYYNKFAPMQEKMFKVMEQEIDSMSENESWKYSDDEDYDQDDICDPDETDHHDNMPF